MRMSGRQRLDSARDDAAACLHRVYNIGPRPLTLSLVVSLDVAAFESKLGLYAKFLEVLQHVQHWAWLM